MNININTGGFGKNNRNFYDDYPRRTKVTQHIINKPWQILIFSLIFVLIGIGLLIYFINFYGDYKEKESKFIETSAVVVDHSYDSDGLAAIVVEYTVNYETYNAISNSRSNMPKSIGSNVKIKYNPNNPSDIIWLNEHGNVFTLLIAIALIILGSIFSFYALKLGRKNGFNSGENESYSYYETNINGFSFKEGINQNNQNFMSENSINTESGRNLNFYPNQENQNFQNEQSSNQSSEFNNFQSNQVSNINHQYNNLENNNKFSDNTNNNINDNNSNNF